MLLRKTITLSLILLVTLSAEGQRKRKRLPAKTLLENIQEPQEDPRITNMREMSQQVIFIDSIVVDKEHILPQLQLSSEAGSLINGTERNGLPGNDYAFVNEMGNKIYFSQSDIMGRQRLYTSDKLGNTWDNATPLQGIGEQFGETAYPFMLSDGITLYFSANGEESIGGYDIFLTRYDSHNGKFLKPENIGMPFNSEANDYLYAIDEFNRIGYFVSDRRQPEGQVCIYIFIPPTARKTYDAERYTKEQRDNFATISRIADTWAGYESERMAALERLGNATIKPMVQDTHSNQQTEINPQIIINDQLSYTKLKDFQSDQAASLYRQLLNDRQQLSTLEAHLDKIRDHYTKAKSSERQSLGKEVFQAEENVLRATSHIRNLEKEIRNIENTYIQSK